MEFVLLLVGVFALLRRRVRLTKTRIVRGRATVAIALLFFVPATVSVLLSRNVDDLTLGRAVDRVQSNENVVLGVSVGCLVAGVALAACCAKYESAGSKLNTDSTSR